MLIILMSADHNYDTDFHTTTKVSQGCDITGKILKQKNRLFCRTYLWKY